LHNYLSRYDLRAFVVWLEGFVTQTDKPLSPRGKQMALDTCPPEKRCPDLPLDFFSPRRPGILVGMRALLSLLWHVRSCLGVLLQLLRYAVSFCWALLLPRAVMAAQLLAIQSQLAAELDLSLGRRKRHRGFSPAFRILWVVLSKLLDR